MRTKIFLAILIVCFLNNNKTIAQSEPMFSQYTFNEIFINPAYSGSHEALSISAVMREQWVNFEGAPSTKTLTMHTPVFKSKVGIGLTIYQDDIGVSSQTGFFANYTYRIKLNKGVLSLGMLGGASGYQERLKEIRTVTADSKFSSNTPMTFAPNFGFGAYYYSKKFYLGLSTPRMMQNTLIIGPQNNIERVDGKYAGDELHYFLATGLIIDINPFFKLRPSGMIKAVLNAPVEYDANIAAFLYNVLWVGTGYRSGDAVNFLTAIQLNNQFRVGYSYDFTITPLRNVAGGSHEISLNYILKYKSNKITSPRYF